MEFDYDSGIDASSVVLSSNPALSQYQIGSIFMSKKSGGEVGAESSNSNTANFNVDLLPQEDRI